MKAVFVTVFAFAASALAGPIIAERQLDTQADQIDALFTQIQGYTASISKLHLSPASATSEDMHTNTVKQTRPPLRCPTTRMS